MWSHSLSESGPSVFASAVTSCAVFPEGKATGIISCVIGNDSLFSNRNVWMPAESVLGAPWYRKFWTKIVVGGAAPFEDDVLLLLHDVRSTRASTETKTNDRDPLRRADERTRGI